MSDEQTSASPDDVKEALAPLLRDGDAFVVRKRDGDVEVEPEELPNTRSALQREDPELYGYLLRVNQRLDDSGLGCGGGLLLIGAILAVCFLIDAQAFHGLVIDGSREQQILDQLRSNWIYGLVTVAGLLAGAFVNQKVANAKYAQEREGLRSRLSRAPQSHDQLLALIEGDGGLTAVGERLKQELEFF